MQEETFISYRGYRWLIVTIGALMAFTVLYWMNDPVGGRHGGTVVGFTYGTLATLGIVWLMAYGVRKRAYAASLGTVQGWLAAHVWLGIGLLLLVPLHAGFSFGRNVHTLAYVLMVITILTGVWGMLNYTTLAARIESHRGRGSTAQVLTQIHSLSQELDSLCRDKSDAFINLANRFDFSFAPKFSSLLWKTKIPHVDQRQAGELMVKVPESEREDSLRLLGMIDQKSDLAITVLEEHRIKTLLRIWLFIHVPASVALCVTVSIHILSVFFFR